jgi:acyl transferase domain-containing protein/NAD(P)H-dependent flavin oxidoreductase YrpB (nitropropane dioxygenase family)/NAD(P)-dependent dehydrogenase (short-subunit alcohol dehydrogenase family)
MQRFHILTCSLPGLSDPGIAIAGSRAGVTGVLDLQYSGHPSIAAKQIQKTGRYTKNDFAVRLNGDAKSWLQPLLARMPSQLKLIILSSDEPETIAMQVRFFRERGFSVLVEAVSLEEAKEAEKAGAKGIIAKGNEAGGRVADETTFILLQRVLKHLDLPVYAQGGIGLHTAAACYAAGAAGIVLDSQLALTRESSIPAPIKTRIAAMDGTETICLGEETGCIYRVCSRLGIGEVKKLQEIEKSIAHSTLSEEEKLTEWRRAFAERASRDSAEDRLYLLGQDVAFAASLAQRFITVGGVVEGIRKEVESHLRVAGAKRVLAEGSPLALSHGTQYPIVQGPMARVSDTPRFIHEVARHGALPFLAAAWLRGQELETILQETGDLLKDRPWGVGMLGFLPPEVYKEQLKTVIAHHPPFALIGGGQAAQARVLEKEGIATYLHVPSPGLLKMFLDEGVRRFVFEGRESGGHIGPLCGFSLWETMIRVLLEYLSGSNPPQEYDVLFAGGIHDALSASMVAAMSASLADQGVRVGVQLGSAYLYTEEAVATGAIVKRFQQEAIRCQRTTVLSAGPGDEERCIDNPFARAFKEQKDRLSKQGARFEETKESLGRLKLGRLRIASKGLIRNATGETNQGVRKLRNLDENDQYEQGLYLIGQLSALRESACTIDALHRDISVGGTERVTARSKKLKVPSDQDIVSGPSDVAIVGMACLVPKAPGLHTYWENILNKVCAIGEVPPNRWDWKLYYDQNGFAKDRLCSKWGGFLEDVPFDPTQYGMPPNSLHSIEPLQLLTLEVTRWALEDAGYKERPFCRERTAVILGISGSGELAQQYGFRTSLPTFFGEDADRLVSHFEDMLPEWTEDSFPGILANVTAGRIANRFNLWGTNFTVDAACASSLAALYLAVRELETRNSDAVIVGGADCMQNPFTFMCFSKTQALSSKGQCSPLGQSADGIILGEGIVVLVLKRLADAERDGDRIYAVIKGIGASSDGKGKSLTAPAHEGQIRALERAYEKARVSPATVGLIEAHATGTVVGDRTEVESLIRVFKEAGAREGSCAIGSVKSMIGHTKSTAGVASLMKAALALHHKALPPTLGVEKPNPALCQPDNPLYVNTEPRPWIHHSTESPRRAGVSALGFGGTNFHVVLEEYSGDYLEHLRDASFRAWPSELFVWTGRTRRDLLKGVRTLGEALSGGASPSLAGLAFAWAHWDRQKRSGMDGGRLSLAIVASSLEDLAEKMRSAAAFFEGSGKDLSDPRGVYFTEKPLGLEGKVAFLFPGQGSQYVNMLSDLAIQFPQIRDCFECSDRILEARLPRPLSSYIFPISVFSEEEDRATRQALAQTQVAQPAMGTADLAMLHFLDAVGIKPDMVAGHSYGEIVALCAAGALTQEDLISLSEARARFIVDSGRGDHGAMAAVSAGVEAVEEFLKGKEQLWVANVNAPQQTIISGSRSEVEEAIKRFGALGIQAARIPVSCAFHSPMVAHASRPLMDFISRLRLGAPRLKVFSNVTAHPYPESGELVSQQLIQHLVSRVDFVRQIEAMYEEGARIFVEVGPGKVMTGLTRQILGERPHLAVISNQAGRSGLVQIQHLLAQLIVQGLTVKTESPYAGRSLEHVDLESLVRFSHKPLPPTTWMVNGARALPLHRYSRSKAPKKMPPLQLDMPQEMTARVCSNPSLERQDMSTPRSCGELPSQGLPSPELSGDGVREVMVRHQQLMQRFLETQKRVMLSYLQGTERPEPNKHKEFQREPSFQEGIQPSLQAERHREEPRESVPQEEPILTGHGNGKPLQDEGVSAPKSSWDRQGLTAKLLDVVSQRTGYPQEMLNLDLDLEAELGVDSIKRVEILGYFLRLVVGSEHRVQPEHMEDLNQFKTLRRIIDHFEAHIVSLEKKGPKESLSPLPSQHPEVSTSSTAPQARLLPRFTVKAVETPPVKQTRPLPSGRVVLLTDDGRGLARALAEKLGSRGNRVAFVQYGESTTNTDPFSYRLEDSSAESIKAVVDAIRRELGAFGGLIHLLPLGDRGGFEQMDLSGWRERLRLDVRTLFYFLKLVENDLKEAKGEGGGFVLSATGLGGSFASEPALRPPDFFPGNGAIPGLLKTLAMEWPEVRVKAVDLLLDEPVSDLAEHLLGEMVADDGVVEVGHRGSKRLCLGLEETRLADRKDKAMAIDSSWVILVTGGARGITAEVAHELARRYQPTLIIAGRSPAPSEQEPAEISHLVDPKALKSALIKNMERQGKPFTVSDVQAAYTRILKDREIRSNLAKMRRAGAKVEYCSVDVRHEHEMASLLDRLYSTYGRLDGVIHGAGIIEDKLLKEKTWESFERVFGTKTESAFILSRALRAATLKFLVLFSSVAGRWGNVGQADYTAANDVINKLGIYLDDKWSGRVVSINWGPWAGSGMASQEVQRQFAERGVEVISPMEGPSLFDLEMSSGRKGEAEVVVGQGPWKDFASLEDLHGEEVYLPLLQDAPVTKNNGFLEIERRLDPESDLYLLDHCLDGKPVLPAAMAVELMAEAAQKGWPEWKLTALQDVRVLKGIVVEEKTRDLRISARPKGEMSPGAERIEIEVTLTDPRRPLQQLYKSIAVLDRRISPPRISAPSFGTLESFWTSPQGAYKSWLFHGPRFQCIRHIEGISKQGMIATLLPSLPGKNLAGAPAGHWLLDPVVLDGGLQLALLWARNYMDITVLPSSFQGVHRFRPFPSTSSIRCYMQVVEQTARQTVIYNMLFADERGDFLGMIDRVEATGSRELNRLAGAPGSMTGA